MLGITIRIDFHIHIIRENKEARFGASKKPQATEKQYDKNLLRLARQKAEELRPSISLSTFDNYMTSIRSLECFLLRPINRADLTPELLRSYEQWLRGRNVCLNTISCYMRSLRSLLTKLCGNEVSNCFDKVFTGQTKTDKRAIEPTCISRLRQLQLAEGSSKALARDLFLFSFYALGMPFVDLCYLRWQHIKDGVLTYARHKTGQTISVHLEQPMIDILNRYANRGSDYVFPLLTDSNPNRTYRQYQSQLSNYNRMLKQLAEEAGISERLTSYTSRHTWASIAFQQNVELPVISKALGHANPQNTLIYIRQINDQRLHQANSKIVKMV